MSVRKKKITEKQKLVKQIRKKIILLKKRIKNLKYKQEIAIRINIYKKLNSFSDKNIQYIIEYISNEHNKKKSLVRQCARLYGTEKTFKWLCIHIEKISSQLQDLKTTLNTLKNDNEN